MHEETDIYKLRKELNYLKFIYANFANKIHYYISDKNLANSSDEILDCSSLIQLSSNLSMLTESMTEFIDNYGLFISSYERYLLSKSDENKKELFDELIRLRERTEEVEEVFNTLIKSAFQSGFLKKSTAVEKVINDFLDFINKVIVVLKAILNGQIFKNYNEVKFKLTLFRQRDPDHQKFSYFFKMLSYEINSRQPDSQIRGDSERGQSCSEVSLIKPRLLS